MPCEPGLTPGNCYKDYTGSHVLGVAGGLKFTSGNTGLFQNPSARKALKYLFHPFMLIYNSTRNASFLWKSQAIYKKVSLIQLYPQLHQH